MIKYLFKFFGLFLSLIFVTSSNSLFAQLDVTIGAGSVTGTTANGATTDAGPMYCTGSSSSFVYSKHHYVYTATELAAAGIAPGMLITQIGRASCRERV